MGYINNCLSAMIIALLSCSMVKNNCDFDISGFDNDIWKNDSLGCLLKRKPLAQKLIDGQKKLIGKDKRAIVNCLGKPNYEKNNSSLYFYQYFIEGGIQCTTTIKDGYDSLEVASIIIFFDKADKVKSIQEIVP